MVRISAGHLLRLAALPLLVPLSMAVSAGTVHACSGNDCPGVIVFGSGYSQKGNGDIFPVHRATTFKLGTRFAMIAHLSADAGTTRLTLRVARGSAAHNFNYTVGHKTSNVVATTFLPSDLKTLRVTSPGKYTFSLLHGSKMLATGSMTEK